MLCLLGFNVDVTLKSLAAAGWFSCVRLLEWLLSYEGERYGDYYEAYDEACIVLGFDYLICSGFRWLLCFGFSFRETHGVFLFVQCFSAAVSESLFYGFADDFGE